MEIIGEHSVIPYHSRITADGIRFFAFSKSDSGHFSPPVIT